MFKPFSLFLGIRYATKIRQETKFISFISSTSVVGLALGVSVLIIVMSVMNGFDRELKHKILGMVPHASIHPINTPVDLDFIAKTIQHPQLEAVAPFIEAQGLLTSGNEVDGTLVYGIDPNLEKDVSIINNYMQFGELSSLSAGSFNLVLGEMLAIKLGVGIGDKVTLLLPEAAISLAGVFPRLRRFTVMGIFAIGADIDSHLAYANIKDLASFLRADQSATNFRLKVKNLFLADKTAREIEQDLPGEYTVSSWFQTHGTLFNAIQIEKKMIALLLLLIIAVAAFNIVSTLMMVVTNKQSDIAILRTFGARQRDILNIFITQGALIGFFGTLIGLIFGILGACYISDIVAFIEMLSGMQFLNPDVYFISKLPSQIQYIDIIYIAITGFSMSIVAAAYPAWRASKIQPAEALRHE